MKKGLLLLSFIICAFVAFAQQRPAGFPSPNSTGYGKIGYQQADSGFIQQPRDTFPAKYPTLIRWSGDNTFWQTMGNGARWFPLASGSLRSIYAGFGLTKVNDSTLRADTSINGVSTWALLKKKIDSVAALTPNITASLPIRYSSGNVSADTGRNSGYLVTGGTLNKVRDSVTQLIPNVSGYKLISDTLFNGGYTTRNTTKKIADSLAALISSGGFGTVLSVSTTDGVGIVSSVASPTANPNISIRVDTNTIATRLRVQKGIDSLGNVITSGLSLKVNISDTASMLTNYRTGIIALNADTATLAARFANQTNLANSKVAYTDTSTMLSGYKTYYPRKALSAGTGISYNQSTGVITNTSPSTGGTVTSIATNAGSGIIGGTITTTGTLTIDTTVVSTKANVTALLGNYKLSNDSSYNTGYTSRIQTKRIIDSLSYSSKYIDTTIIQNRSVFIDQFLNNFYGRGMLTEEPINILTEQNIGSSYAAGVDVIKVSDTSKFKVGGLATIKHTNGKYYTYFISQKGGDGVSGTLGIKPSLQYPVTSASKIERTWFNRAHPGKFYMRQLAQQIAYSTEINSAIPTGNRILYTNFSDTPSLSKDNLTALGGATVNYYAASNTGIDSASPIRFPLGNTPYVAISSAGDGAETPLFYIDRPAQLVASVSFMSSNNSNAYSIRIINDSGRTVATYKIPTSSSKNTTNLYKFPFSPSFSNKIKVRIIADTVTTSANLSIAQIDVFEQAATNKLSIGKRNAVIVGLGDSWMQGDLGSTAEREPITQQLALEMPYATIINAGVGGNTITDMLNRFDTDVTPYNPDYVIIETGTNDVYNPPSVLFYPTGVDDWINLYNQLIYKVLSIGAKPIILGVPALAQSDADVPTWPEWILNDRARLYAQKFYRFLGKQTSEGGDYEWKVNVSDTSAMLTNYLRGIVQTNKGGTGKSTWTSGSIPFIGSGSGSPFVEVNNSLFYDSTNKALRIGNNSNFYNEQLSIGAYTTPKITMVATGGYYWSTRVDGADNQQWKLRYDNDDFDVIVADRLHDVTFGGNITASSIKKSGGTSSQILAADGSVITAGTGITISGGAISASGSGSYVPYTGATSNVALAANSLSFTTGQISLSTGAYSTNISQYQLRFTDNGTGFYNELQKRNSSGYNISYLQDKTYTLADSAYTNSGTYTPTLTNTTNISSSSLSQATYSRVGNIVHVNVAVSLTPTLSTTNTVLTISLPQTTATGTQSYVGNGTVFGNAVSNLFSSGLVSIASTTTATFTFQSMALTSSNANIQFDYKIN